MVDYQTDLQLSLPYKFVSYVQSFVYLEDGYELEATLIPKSNKIDCHMKARYRERFGGCSCGSYCSWDLCRTNVAPTDCLAGTGGVWKWDISMNAWVAQIVNGITSHFKVSPYSKFGYKSYHRMF